MVLRSVAAILFSFAVSACGDGPDRDHSSTGPESSISTEAASAQSGAEPADAVALVDLDKMGERFVKLALALGHYDEAFVDAYHGPSEWAADIAALTPSKSDLKIEAEDMLGALQAHNAQSADIRSVMLERLILAAVTRIEMSDGTSFSFDEETRRLYDVVAPEYNLAEFDAILAEIELLLPGEGSLADRVTEFRKRIEVPEDKLQSVFDAAIAACRARTLQHYALPDTEQFALEFVTEKPWSGYNWYQGGFESLIQINTDFPILIDRAVDLGCHEGYPGHHTWNIYIERDLLEQAGWIEYSIYPLFSPLSVIAEGSANYGIRLAFPGLEKSQFEQEVLFPLAEIDAQEAQTLTELNALLRRLAHVRNHIAREYLDGRISREEAIDLNVRYRLESPGRAEQSVRFIETYRGYVVNYTIGLDIVDGYVSRLSNDDPETRWAAFETLLKTPLSASDLMKAGQDG